MFGKKSSFLKKRLKKIEKELSSVNSNIKSLSKQTKPLDDVPSYDSRGISPGNSTSDVRPDQPKVGRQEEEYLEDLRKGVHDERFVDYLSSSFESVRPLRHERRIQRNRAIFMLIVALLVLVIVIYKIFL